MRPLIVLVSYPSFGSIAVPPCLLLDLFRLLCFDFLFEYFAPLSVCIRINVLFSFCIVNPMSRFLK